MSLAYKGGGVPPDFGFEDLSSETSRTITWAQLLRAKPHLSCPRLWSRQFAIGVGRRKKNGGAADNLNVTFIPEAEQPRNGAQTSAHSTASRITHCIASSHGVPSPYIGGSREGRTEGAEAKRGHLETCKAWVRPGVRHCSAAGERACLQVPHTT